MKRQPYPVKIIHEEISSPYKMTDIKDGLELQRPQKKIFKYVPTQNKKFTGTGGAGCEALSFGKISASTYHQDRWGISANMKFFISGQKLLLHMQKFLRFQSSLETSSDF